MQTILRKYGESAIINFDLFETDGIDFKVDAVHVAGDTKISKNEGTEANTTNGFVDNGQGYSITLTATEMEAARVVLYVADQGTKTWLDTALVIETYGNASAQHAFDLDTASVAQTGDSYARIGANGAGLTAIDLPDQTMNITGNLSGSVGSVTAAVETDAASRTASQADVSNLDVAVSTRSSHSAADVWAATTRTLTSFGTLVADTASAVWAAVTRTLTAGTKDTEIDSIKAVTDNIPDSGAMTSIAQDSTVAKEASLFDPATDTVVNVTNVANNADMRGTDGAITDLTGVATEAKQDTIIADIADVQVDVTEILDYEAGDWEITNDQMIFKTKAGATLATYNLTKAGVPDSDAPDKREKV